MQDRPEKLQLGYLSASNVPPCVALTQGFDVGEDLTEDEDWDVASGSASPQHAHSPTKRALDSRSSSYAHTDVSGKEYASRRQRLIDLKVSV